MRIAVAGGTGLVGRHTVRAITATQHEAVIIARSHGVDVITGHGLGQALVGVDALIDVTNTSARTLDDVTEFFGTATRNLLAAEAAAGVRHHVLLSIAAVERVPGNPHYAGKLLQERLVGESAVPWTILRATQFHGFAAMVAGWSQHDGQAVVPPLLLQPVAARDVGQKLATLAVGTAQGRLRDFAGPDTQDLVDMARRTLAARGKTLRLIPSWRGPFGIEAAGEVFLPSADAELADTTFDAWSATEDAIAG